MYLKKSSLTIRAKYLDKNIDFIKTGGYCFGCDRISRTFLYEGKMLKVPINYKVETEFFLPRVNFFIAAGFALNITLKEEFLELYNLTPLDNKVNVNFNISSGFIFSINSKWGIYCSQEVFIFGNEKSKEKIFDSQLGTQETLINLGFRYKLQ